MKLKREWALEGLKIGLQSFLMSYGVALVISIIVNFAIMSKMSALIQGTLADDFKVSVLTILRTAGIILNMSVFNAAGALKVGVLIFAAIPFFAFYMSHRKDLHEEGLGLFKLTIYGCASVAFTILLVLLSLATKGSMFGSEVSFISIGNIGISLFVTFIIQLVLGLSFTNQVIPGLKATKRLLQMNLGLGLVVGVVALFFIASKVVANIFAMIFMVLLLLPNVATYIMFLIMGTSIQLSDPLEKMMSFANMNISFDVIPLGIRLAFVFLFIIMIVVALLSIDENQYVKNVLIFDGAFSIVSVLLAYVTGINLGNFKNVIVIQFGINMFQAFIIPFVLIAILGALVYAVRHMIHIVKS